jgi:hypothetical protein
MDTVEQKIDRFIHDAEHKEAGAEFAELMARKQPHNPTHKRMAAKLKDEARTLRAMAADLERSRNVDS